MKGSKRGRGGIGLEDVVDGGDEMLWPGKRQGSPHSRGAVGQMLR